MSATSHYISVCITKTSAYRSLSAFALLLPACKLKPFGLPIPNYPSPKNMRMHSHAYNLFSCCTVCQTRLCCIQHMHLHLFILFHEVSLRLLQNHTFPPSLPPSLSPRLSSQSTSWTALEKGTESKEATLQLLQPVWASVFWRGGGVPEVKGKLTPVLLIPHHRRGEAQVAAYV